MEFITASSGNGLGTLDSLKKGFIKKTLELFKERELDELLGRRATEFLIRRAFVGSYFLFFPFL
jgi:hypothetical protein